MESHKLTEYERKRLENIKRNGEMMNALNIHSKASQLSASSKRQRVASKSYRSNVDKKLETPIPLVIRKSLRARGMPPDSIGLDIDFVESVNKTPKSLIPTKPSPCYTGPVKMGDAYDGPTGSDKKLIDFFLDFDKKPNLGSDEKQKCQSSFDLESLSLEPENVARVVRGKIMAVKFLTSADKNMIIVGNKYGNLGFWNMDGKDDEEDGLFLYKPHSSPISGILSHQASPLKIYTSCYDGFIRFMDIEKEVFDLVYSSNDTIYSLAQQPNDVNSLYFGEGRGEMSVWDLRTGKSSTHWMLHAYRINSIDFSSENPYIMATSSTDGTACLWDLRSMDADQTKTLLTVKHKKAVHSAYFSPTGSSIVTTSLDDTVGILSGANFEDTCMIHHDNQTGRWVSSFRGRWGWDDSYIFIGNMRRGVDVIDTSQRKIVKTIQSDLVSAIPCRLDSHPFNVGMLAGATSGGQVYVWTPSH